MEKYKHTQIGWFVIALFVGSWVFMLLSFLKSWGNNPITLAPLLALSGIFLMILLIFYKLSVEIDEEHIIVTFGIGMAKKTIPLSSIEKAEKTA